MCDVEMQKCVRCKEIKEKIKFHPNKRNYDRLKNLCLTCHEKEIKQKKKENSKRFYENNYEKFKASQDKYKSNNRNKINKKIRDNYNNNEEINKKTREWKKKYYEENREKILEQKRNRPKEVKNKKIQDPAYRLRKNISRGISRTLTNKKECSCLIKLGITVEDIIKHFELLFEPWMTWDNYGPYKRKGWKDDDSSTWKWNIDHIIPQCMLKFTSMDDDNFKKCWALENLRPLSAKANFLRGQELIKKK